MHLFLIRHGECEGLAKSDAERELTAQGIADVQKMAHHVTSLGLQPEHILASPLKRAIQTAELFQVGWKTSIEIKDCLRPTALPSEVLAEIQAYSGDNCALVGHLPNLGLLLGTLIWGISAKEIVIAKGGAAHLILKNLEPGSAKLRWLLTPDSLSQ